MRRKVVYGMPQKEIFDKISIYIPHDKRAQKPVERLIKLGEKKDRSVNYLCCGGDFGVSKTRREQVETSL